MSYREKARLFEISTVVVMVLTGAFIVALPFVMRVLMYRVTGITSPSYVVGFTLAACLFILPFVLMLLSVHKIFSNITHGIVYNQSNVFMLRRISLCSGFHLGISIAGFVVLFPIFGYEIVVVCLFWALISLIALSLSLGFEHFLKTELLRDAGKGEGYDNR